VIILFLQNNPIITIHEEVMGVWLSFDSHNKGQTNHSSLQILPLHGKWSTVPRKHIHGDYFPKGTDVFSSLLEHGHLTCKFVPISFVFAKFKPIFCFAPERTGESKENIMAWLQNSVFSVKIRL